LIKFYFIAILAIFIIFNPIYAQTSLTLPTEKKTLDVKLSYDEIILGAQSKLHIDFINPQTKKIQEHIDYTVTVSKNDKFVFGPIPLTHTAIGSVTIPVEFVDDGVYSVDIGIEGILFQPISKESVSFKMAVGDVESPPTKVPSWIKNIFGWYAQDKISEDELLNAIQFLINQKILIVD